MTTERDFQGQVVELARMFGWRVHHGRAGQTAGGRWATQITGDVGFCDLVLVRDRVIFAELKSETGRLGPGQQEWLDAIRDAGGNAYLWRPSDLEHIARVLAFDAGTAPNGISRGGRSDGGKSVHADSSTKAPPV